MHFISFDVYFFFFFLWIQKYQKYIHENKSPLKNVRYKTLIILWPGKGTVQNTTHPPKNSTKIIPGSLKTYKQKTCCTNCLYWNQPEWHIWTLFNKLLLHTALHFHSLSSLRLKVHSQHLSTFLWKSVDHPLVICAFFSFFSLQVSQQTNYRYYFFFLIFMYINISTI